MSVTNREPKVKIWLLSADFVWSDEWVEFEGHSYKFFADTVSPSDTARTLCRQQGAQLVSINSPEEQEFLSLKVLRQRILSAFIGGERNSGNTLKTCLVQWSYNVLDTFPL